MMEGRPWLQEPRRDRLVLCLAVKPLDPLWGLVEVPSSLSLS